MKIGSAMSIMIKKLTPANLSSNKIDRNWIRNSNYTVKNIYEIPGFFLTKPSWDREKSVLRRNYFRIFGPIHRKDFFCFEDVKSVLLMEG